MKNKQLFWILLLIVCSTAALLGLFHSGFFVSDDGHWMIIRLSAFYEGLSSGQFPVRFLPRLNEGLGYPVADFLYPLFLYVGSLLHILKIPYILDVKIIFGVSMLLSGVAMFLFLKRNFSDLAAFFGGIIYIYLPYHLYDMYNRGSLGEVIALAIAPLLFWAIEKKSWVLLGVFLGLLIVSHNTLALFFLPAAVLYALLRKRKVSQLLYSVCLGLGLAAFFWVPALYDKQFTVFDSIAVSNPANYFVNIVDYRLVGWIALAIFGGIILTRPSVKNTSVFFFFCIGIVSLFFSMSLSGILWQSKLLSQFVQFPFRFLSITLVAESFLCAYLVDRFKNKILPSILLVLLVGFSSWPYLLPKQYDYYDNSYYATNLATTTVQNEYMPKWVQKIPTAYAPQKVFVPKGMGSISNIMQKGTRISFNLTLIKKSAVKVGYVYFPGWYAAIDGREVDVIPSSISGLVQFSVPAGMHTVVVSYKETSIHAIADVITLVSIGFLLVYIVKRKVSSSE